MTTRDPLTGLYPEIEPYSTATLKVSALHTLYFEECGNPKGKPVVFIHGGPGGQISGKERRFFNPELYRIILFDQRGCGKSTPYASLEENTTWDLVSDIEKLREHLKIDRWQVFGGSWGSTLSLSYAVTHPERVTELVLRGIFLLRRKELEFFYQEGASWIFPEEWEKYLAIIPESERHDLIAAYHRRIMSSDPKIATQAQRAWSTWEGSTSKLIPAADFISRYSDDTFALAFARIESHYFQNRAFFPEDDFLLKNVHKIHSIPGTIVQGRYDVVCPAKSAWDLHRAWPKSKLIIIPDAGHSLTEPGISKALTDACDAYAKQ